MALNMWERKIEVSNRTALSSDLVLANSEGFGWVVLAVKMHFADGVLVFHPIVHGNYLCGYELSKRPKASH